MSNFPTTEGCTHEPTKSGACRCGQFWFWRHVIGEKRAGESFIRPVPWWRRRCLNCGEPGRCLCWPCLRAIVVPLLLAEAIHWLVGRP